MASYNIASYSDLKTIKDDLAGDYTLTADIDASDSEEENAIAGFPGTYNGFEPVGSTATPFTGTLDGGSFTISNLYINRGDESGLFGLVSVASGTIHDVTIKDATIICATTGGGVGILAGKINGTSGNNYIVDECHVSGTITVGASGDQVGGIVGRSTHAEYTDCTSSVAISVVPIGAVGGMIGSCADADFTDCLSGGTIVASGASASGIHLGGFVGYTDSTASSFTSCKSTVSIADSVITSGGGYTANGGFAGYNSSGTILYCLATGIIISNNTYITYSGGFCGWLKGTATECASTGDVSVPSIATTAYIGGFAGMNEAVITDCYSRGDICKSGIGAGTYYVGGMVGQNNANIIDSYSVGYVDITATKYGGFIGEDAAGAFTTCYWDTETSGTTDAAEGGAKAGITGNTTEDMKLEATYTGFDFNATWEIPTYTQNQTLQSNLTVWLSKKGEYENFEAGTKDSDSFSIVIPTTNEIRWLESLESLLVGTAGGEWRIGSNRLDTALSPTNVSAKRQTTHGSKNLQALSVNSSVLFADYVGRKIRELTYEATNEKYVAPDLSELAEHITKTGIVNMAHQKNPNSIVWIVLTDGSLLSMVYDRQQDVVAWSDHPTDGTVQSVCVIPGTDEDEVWISVTRTNGLFIEKMMPRDFGDDLTDAFFVDSGITATPVGQTVSGLTHLAGETVVVHGDGVQQTEETSGDFVVTVGGEITVPAGLTTVQAGLPHTFKLQPMRIVFADANGTTFGSTTRVNELVISFLNSLGVNYGDEDSNLFAIDFDDEKLEPETYIAGLFSGDVPVTMPGGFSTQNPIIISGSSTYPCTIRALIAKIDRTGR